jgi:PAS domain S-box-containing protein
MQAHADAARWMAVTISTDGLIASLSSRAEQLTGYAAEDLIGRPVTHIMADRSIFDVPRMLDSAKEWGYWDGEVVHRSRSGKSFEARATLTPLAGQDDSVWGYLLVSMPDAPAGVTCNSVPLRDVAAKLRMISHELNNPLAVMMGFAQLILLNTRCDGQIRIDMEKLYSELKRVIQVVERLHNYAIALQDEYSADQAAVGSEE